jgi:hypothetical protein
VSLPLGRPVRIVGIALAGATAVVALTWLFEHAIAPPFSGYLALILVGLAVTHVLRRQPQQQAYRLFFPYFRARERGADEVAARARLLARAGGGPGRADAIARAVTAAWSGPSERERAVAGVAALLAERGRPVGRDVVAAAYDRARDRFTIPGWEALPREFVEAVRGRLDERERGQLEALAEKYRLFQQRFFRRSTSLGADPAASLVDFARLLASLGNRMAAEAPGDAERAYRLSVRLRPEENLAHGGLAILLGRVGRAREAVVEARLALSVLDDYAARAADRDPTPEDISPFRSPKAFREALERLAGPS